jgi:hypothetical protein
MLSKDFKSMSDDTKSIAAATYQAAEEYKSATLAAMNQEADAASAARHQFTAPRGWTPTLPHLPTFTLFFTADEFLCERRPRLLEKKIESNLKNLAAGAKKETAAKKVESKDTSDGVTEARPSDSDGGAGGSDRGVKGGVEGGGGLLRICKHSFCFEFDVKATPPALAQKKEIVAVLGVVHVQSEAFLVVVTAAEFVGEVCGAAVWGVRKVDMLPFLMLSSPSAISRSSEVLEELGSLQTALCHHGFYFSYAVDLSDPAILTSRAAVYSREKGAAESEKVLNTDFCWNKEMMADFAALPGPLAQEWAAPLIHGACHGDRLEKCDVLILARRRRAGGETGAESLRVDVFLEEDECVVSKEFAAAMTASGGNMRDVGESVSDALLDLRLQDQVFVKF